MSIRKESDSPSPLAQVLMIGLAVAAAMWIIGVLIMLGPFTVLLIPLVGAAVLVRHLTRPTALTVTRTEFASELISAGEVEQLPGTVEHS
jgi:hypothetical protein